MIGFLGLSHLGLSSAAAAAAKGFQVVAFDEDPELIRRVLEGDLPVAEPGLEELLSRERGSMTFTSERDDLARCDPLYVAIDVPTGAQDQSNQAPVDRLLIIASDAAAPGACVIVLSQIQPGFTRSRQAVVERQGGRLFYQVETLIFGRAVERALAPERFIIGCADPSQPLPAALSQHLDAYGCPVLSMRYESAELTKIAVNAFLVSSISTTNTLAELCERTGADWHEITPALRLDRRIGMHAYLAPGLGIGGPNLSRDLATIESLAAVTGADASIVDAWREHAEHRVHWPLAILHDRTLSRVDAPRVAMWGLAYKENTASTRNSPGLRLARTLAEAGVTVKAYDPEADAVSIESESFRRVGDPLAACEDAHALVVATPWALFATIPREHIARALQGRLVIDPHDLLGKAACHKAGLEHARLGDRVTAC